MLSRRNWAKKMVFDPAETLASFSVSTVQRIWRAFGLKRHHQETFKLSTDPDFVAWVRDAVGLYSAPPEHPVVLCVDEKSQIQALDRNYTVFPRAPGNQNGGATITPGTGRHRCSLPSTSPPER